MSNKVIDRKISRSMRSEKFDSKRSSKARAQSRDYRVARDLKKWRQEATEQN